MPGFHRHADLTAAVVARARRSSPSSSSARSARRPCAAAGGQLRRVQGRASTPPLDPLTTADGRKVTTPDLWNQVRRPELLRLFETEMYGKVPQPPEPIRPMVRLRSEDTQRPGRDRHPPRGHDRVLGEAGRAADGPPDLPAEGRRPVAARARRSWA